LSLGHHFLVMVSEIWCTGSIARFIRSPVWMKQGHCLGLVFCVPFSALTLEGHPARKETHSTNPQRFLLSNCCHSMW